MADQVVVVALIGGVVAVIGTAGALVGVLSKNTTDRRTALEVRLDRRIDAAIEAQEAEIASLRDEVSTIKRHMTAVGRIFRAIRDQWPDAHGPMLDAADIAELEGTEVIPREWIRKR